eukprot:g20952.t1
MAHDQRSSQKNSEGLRVEASMYGERCQQNWLHAALCLGFTECGKIQKAARNNAKDWMRGVDQDQSLRRSSLAELRVMGEPLEEPPHHEFFGGRSVERLRQISPNDFDERIRLGKPFIIEDAGENLDLVGSTCQQFHERFPSAKMRAEYSGGERCSFRLEARHGLRRTGLKELSRTYDDGGHEAPPEVRAAVQEAWQPPYFVRGAVNLREANESAEFWFHRRNGAVMAHADAQHRSACDTYCIPAVSLQITGQKHWRLMPHPKVHFSRDAPEPHDGGIYGADWLPFWEATVQQGEAIVFFPNIFHETHVPEDNPECTVATTFQIQLPIPARYLRAYLPTFAMSHLYYEGHCRDLWDPYATLRPPKAAKATTKEAAIEKEHASLVASIDDEQRPH